MKRAKGTSIKSWELTDSLWEQVQGFIPQRKRDEGKSYTRKPGGGRKPLPPRQILEGIFYVLRTGIRWKALPQKYGAASSAHQYFSEWAQAGLFQRMWQEGVIAYDLLKGLGWEWQSADGCMVKAPLAREAAGNNPTGRGKKGTKRSVVVESHGLPPGMVLDGANRHDVKLPEPTVRAIVIPRPEGAGLCLDAGYVGAQRMVEALGYVPHIRPRGAERLEKERNPHFKGRRRVVSD